MTQQHLKLGIDVGSTTAKVVITNHNNEIIFKAYRRHNAAIKATLCTILREASSELGNHAVSPVFTGSAGMGLSEKLTLPFVQEVVAAAEYIKYGYPNVRTLIDIGGEDSKMIFFAPGKQPDIRMNGSCAGGTGAFIDQMASLMNIAHDDLDTLAADSTNIYPIASRCGVFAKTDIQNLVARRIANTDIAASVFHAVALQVINALAKGQDVEADVIFIGGPLKFFKHLRKAFARVLQIQEEHIVLPAEAELVPAIGAALSEIQENHKVLPIDEFIHDLETKTDVLQVSLDSRLKPLFKDADERKTWLDGRGAVNVQRTSLAECDNQNLILGLDSGSTTTKTVITDNQQRVVFTKYIKNQGNPLEAVKASLLEFFEQAHKDGFQPQIVQAAVTGYGEDLIRSALGIDHGLVETIAHFSAAQKICPTVSFILDIGGQDIKAIYIRDGIITNLEINEACSSGCGSFIENFANSMGYAVSEFAQMACESEFPCDLGTRCTVFMNSKVKQAFREGATPSDISAGLSYSVIRNCLYKILKLRDISDLGDYIVVQGGAFKNVSLQRVFENLTEKPVYITDIPELMGAYGCALFALSHFEKNSNVNTLSYESIAALDITASKNLTCKGCENFCTITRFTFQNDTHFFTGNKCEKVFTNKGTNTKKGVDVFNLKNELLFERPSVKGGKRIGIPRVLNMYENYPFWHALLSEAGFEVVLSSQSTVKLAEKSTGTVMSDNICFPAKLVHGHVTDLLEQGVERLFYPMVLFERKEQVNAANSFNCPIVTGYAEVIDSSMNLQGVPLDRPTVTFNNPKQLQKQCVTYLESLGVSRTVAKRAFIAAETTQVAYRNTLASKIKDIVADARRNKRMMVLLSGRPYHADMLIQHKISSILTEYGVDVLSVDVTMLQHETKFEDLFIIPQWAYTNKIVSAAQWMIRQPDELHFIQLNSFGCGPDAFVIDEVSDILKHAGHNHTLIKIDEINSTGSVRLRLRSLIESLKLKGERKQVIAKKRKNTPDFTMAEAHRDILVPHFSDIYSPLVAALFKAGGYNLITLPKADSESVELGLKNGNNEVCFPATVVLGDAIKALKSGNYDDSKIAIGISQTGGQCRATNYLMMIRKAMINNGFDHVPIISITTGDAIGSSQEGFQMPWRKLIKPAVISTLYADALARMYYTSKVRAVDRDAVRAMLDLYIERARPLIENTDMKALMRLLKEAVSDFNDLEYRDFTPAKIGIVGEIYIKYNQFGNLDLCDWLIEQDIEPVVPPIYEFFLQYFVNRDANVENLIDKPNMINNMIVKVLEMVGDYYFKRVEDALSRYKFYRPAHSVRHLAERAEKVCSLIHQYGEGWLIPGGIAQFAEEGIHNVVSIQPFGCIANQVIAKGLERKLKREFPHLNLLHLDFDANTSVVNVHNRLYFLVRNAREMMNMNLDNGAGLEHNVHAPKKKKVKAVNE